MTPVVHRGAARGAAAIARDEMDDETPGEIARRYWMEVIGPVPEGSVL